MLALARAAFAFVPNMWGWSLDAQRFLPPLAGWTLWLLAALALAPALARPLVPALARAGDAIADSPLASALAYGAAGALLTWALPDRLHFVGDFQLRLSALETEVVPIAKWSHVALPLEVLLHDHLVRGFHAALGLGWVDATRLLGAIEAGLLGALATGFARVLRLRGAGAFAACAIVLCGGYLTLFTGYNKAFMETSLLTIAVAIAAIALARDGRGAFALGLAAAAAFASHRSGLALLAPLVAAWALAARTAEGRAALRRPIGVVAMVLPLAALAAMARDMISAMRQYDQPHFAPGGVASGIIAAALAPLHLSDLLNLVVALSPLAIVTPALFVAVRAWRHREAQVLLALVVPYAGMMLFVHTHQGLFRDLDCFAAAGVALSLLAAWLVARAIEAAPRRAWIAVAVTLGVLAPALQWLLLPTDLERGLARARAFVTESPARGAGERAETWDFIGLRYFKLQRWAEGAVAFEKAAETAPSPRILTEWAICAAGQHDFATSQALYRRVVAASPQDEFAWRGLAGSSYQLRRLDEAERAASMLLTLVPDDPDALHILAVIARVDSIEGRTRR